MQAKVLSTLVLASATLIAGCSKAPSELAPVQGGETFTWRFVTDGGRSSYTATLTLEKVGDARYRLAWSPDGGHAPLEVDGALMDGRTQLKAHYIGQLWIPPSEREGGKKPLVGLVKGTVPKTPWKQTLLVEGTGGREKRYYDPETGFLVAMILPIVGGSFEGELAASSIPGLVAR